jgi:hypothetical protein
LDAICKHGWRAAWGVSLLCVIAAQSGPARAWVYPEHRTIALVALRELDAERRKTLQELWADARRGNEARLCEVADAAEQGEEPTCIDYAAWPAIAGDHSCSSREMLDSVLSSDWILDVADAAARLKRRLAKTKGRDALINAVRDSDIDLQRSDPEYATRAGSNTVHFLRARDGVATTSAAYAQAVFTEGVETNAIAAYALYHIDALEKARGLASPSLSPQQRSALALAVLADEAFALHFLEDVFAAGHVAGSWGDVALRRGTHDYYNEHGLAVTTWAGDRTVLTGDAWMRPADAERAAATVRKSLEQVLDAARGTGRASEFQIFAPPSSAPGTLDVCRTDNVPKRVHDTKPLLVDVLLDTPVPMLASGLGAMPRFRAELGPFIGVQAAARTSTMSGGFGESQTNVGGTGALELGVRLGFGLEGVMNEAGDGLVFLDLGIRRDGSSTNRFGEGSSVPDAGAITAATPARAAWAARLRLPFWLLPMDMLVLGPVMLLASPSTLQEMAVIAGNGGLIPWQSRIATPLGSFQFILGREVGVSLFGYPNEDHVIVGADEGDDQDYVLVQLSSIQLDFPVLEYQPFRSFSTDQSSSLVFQFFGAVDIPSRVSVASPEDAREPDVKPVWHIGLRLSFDWRAYF